MANRLRDFTLSDPIFIDTNIFVYQQAAHPDFGPDCRDLLHIVETGTLQRDGNRDAPDRANGAAGRSRY